MRLTPHFTLEELEVTETGLPNTAPAEAVERLWCLCAAVLEPWRERIGGIPLRVTSGYRSRAVNDELRRRGRSASSTSQHLIGEAVDVQPVPVVPLVPLVSVWCALVDLARAGLPVDQAIVYQRPPGEAWFHVSHTFARAPRRELLVQLDDGETYVPWSEFRGPLVTS